MIKKIKLLVLVMATSLYAMNASAYNMTVVATKDGAVVENLQKTSSVEDFLKITPKQIKEQTGHKLSIKEAIALKMAQKQMRQAMSPESRGGSKSQIIATLLCFFAGTLGIHRFYLGYTWQGLVQLFTAGGCGIWTLIDFIRILMGDLKPKDGSDYDPSF